MKLETFFEKFDQLAYNPDAVAKIRDLVLELAITGKLLLQNNQDEPAFTLLVNARVEKARLVSDKKIKYRNLTRINPNEYPFPPPPKWEWARLSDVGYELGQQVPNKKFSYIDVGSIDSDLGRISDRIKVLSPNEAPSRARKLVAQGTVIYATVRPYLKNIAVVDRNIDPKPIVSTAFGILHPFANINSRYLFYWLRGGIFTSYVQETMKGMAYPAINDEKFYNGLIAVPPLAEQKRIVAKVDELMALCDKLEEQLRERDTRQAVIAHAALARFEEEPTPENLELLFNESITIAPDDLRKTILNLALHGKLVPQDKGDEKIESIREISPRTLPLVVPESWCWTIFGEIGEIAGGFAFRSEDYSPSGIFILRVTNIETSGEINIKKPVFLPENKVTKEVEKFYLNEGDILLVMVGGSLGKIGIVSSEILPALLNQNLWRIKPRNAEIDNHYLKLLTDFLVSFQRIITHSTHGHLSREEFRKKPVAIPPIAEQHRIVAKVDQLMALIDQYEKQLNASRENAKQLLDAMVAELTTES